MNNEPTLAKRGMEYFIENTRKNRQIDKQLGIRYRSQEAKAGETFGEFKKRMKDSKLVFVICTWAFTIPQVVNASM